MGYKICSGKILLVEWWFQYGQKCVDIPPFKRWSLIPLPVNVAGLSDLFAPMVAVTVCDF